MVEPGVGSRFSTGPVSIVASTDMPGRTRVPSAGLRIQHDLDRDALHDLGEVAGGIVGRQQREGAAGAGRPAVDMAGQRQVGKRVHGDARRVAETHVGHLRLLVVRDDPDRGSGTTEITWVPTLTNWPRPHLAQADQAVGRRDDAGIVDDCCCASVTCASAALHLCL